MWSMMHIFSVMHMGSYLPLELPPKDILLPPEDSSSADRNIERLCRDFEESGDFVVESFELYMVAELAF